MINGNIQNGGHHLYLARTRPVNPHTNSRVLKIEIDGPVQRDSSLDYSPSVEINLNSQKMRKPIGDGN